MKESQPQYMVQSPTVMWYEQFCVERIPMSSSFQCGRMKVGWDDVQMKLQQTRCSMVANFEFTHLPTFKSDYVQCHRVHFVQQAQVVPCQLQMRIFLTNETVWSDLLFIRITNELLSVLFISITHLKNAWNIFFGQNQKMIHRFGKFIVNDNSIFVVQYPSARICNIRQQSVRPMIISSMRHRTPIWFVERFISCAFTWLHQKKLTAITPIQKHAESNSYREMSKTVVFGFVRIHIAYAAQTPMR